MEPGGPACQIGLSHGIDSLESIPELLTRLQFRALEWPGPQHLTMPPTVTLTRHTVTKKIWQEAISN
jgi:hypothetical protein